jgi:starvation-inducible DNA-binding protein
MAHAKKQSSEMIPVLGAILSDTYVLYVKTQNFHWNVVDPTFFMLHELFEKQYRQLAESVDIIAEQVRILGGTPPHSMRQFLEHATLVEAEGHRSAPEMVEELASDHERMRKLVHDAIHQAEDACDEGTADMLTDRLREHDKNAWMLRSHRG